MFTPRRLSHPTHTPVVPALVRPAGAAALASVYGARRADGLNWRQCGWVLAGIVLLHGAGAWGLLQLRTVPEPLPAPAPIFVSWIAAPAAAIKAAARPGTTTPAAVKAAAQPRPSQPVRTPAPAALIAAVAPAPGPAPEAGAPAQRHDAAVPDAAGLPNTVTASGSAAGSAVSMPAPMPMPTVAPAPLTIAASAVQYLEPPVLVYPHLSQRNGERGRVMVRVLIDPAGLPREVRVAVSSGFVRLDQAAVAAVRLARFKPHTENGQALAAWTQIPADFL